MCGRFTLALPPEMLAEVIGEIEPGRIQPRYNIAPTQQVAVVRQDVGGQRHLSYLRWGFIPPWAKDASVGSIMIFAGIWESWKSPEEENIETCTILTTNANSLIRPIHDRMPVILGRSDWTPGSPATQRGTASPAFPAVSLKSPPPVMVYDLKPTLLFEE